MNLEHFIQHLLYHFDCVIIPQFGGIMAQPVSASVNVSQHIFYAPKKQLAFNKNLDKSDGLLVNHVALNMNISYAQASAWVEDQVKIWKDKLVETGKLNVAEVGQFKLDKDQNILFEPASFVNYQVESFGFSSFHASPVSATKAQPIYQDKAKPKFVKEKAKKSKEASKFNFKKLIPYAVALPILAAMVYIPTQTTLLKNTKVYYSNLLPFSQPNMAKYSERINIELPNIVLIPQATEPEAMASNSEPLEMNTELVKPIEKKEVAATIHQEGKVHLIVGAFSSELIANTFISELKAKGFKAYIQGKNAAGLIRVSCNSFRSKTEATNAKAELPSDIMNAWVLAE